jgi:GTP-binding protein YchF
MNLSIGIIGLPNVGKSTLFKALTKKQIDIANYPFCTIEPNTGVVEVPDHRVEQLSIFSNSQKIIQTFVKFIDIAGLVKGASQGEGLGNKFLSHIRETDAICQVVRCFEDKNIIHVHGRVNPFEDIEIVNTELILADLKTVENSLIRNRRLAKGQDSEALKNIATLSKIEEALSKNILARNISFEEEEQVFLKTLNLLTLKPVLYIGNISEKEISLPESELQKKYKLPSPCLFVSAKIESELSELGEKEKKEFLETLNLKESGLDRLIKKGYALLNLITFITTGPKETRAWTISKNTFAPQAAGQIHSDLERGFIAAEIINWQDLLNSGSHASAISSGKIKTKGKNYVMEDGDVAEFKFSV